MCKCRKKKNIQDYDTNDVRQRIQKEYHGATLATGRKEHVNLQEFPVTLSSFGKIIFCENPHHRYFARYAGTAPTDDDIAIILV